MLLLATYAAGRRVLHRMRLGERPAGGSPAARPEDGAGEAGTVLAAGASGLRYASELTERTILILVSMACGGSGDE